MNRDIIEVEPWLYVTKPFLPPREEYDRLLNEVWESGILTNNGPLVRRLEFELGRVLDFDNVLFTSNGTIALQMAIKALNLSGEVITTSFSYVATTNSIIWENCTPIFADIEGNTWNIDVGSIANLITDKTTAIMATHVFGNPCNVFELEDIAKKHDIKLIYDAAHAFGVKLGGESVFKFGDISTTSFHATKLFQTGEGGAVFAKDTSVFSALKLVRSFGHYGDDYYLAGVNGKNSEIHAAMGLAVLPFVNEIIANRRQTTYWYNKHLEKFELQRQELFPGTEYNFSYYPIVFPSERILNNVISSLLSDGIVPRRYFYPSLNTLPFLTERASCPVSERIDDCVLCLPLFYGMTEEIVEKVVRGIERGYK